MDYSDTELMNNQLLNSGKYPWPSFSMKSTMVNTEPQ